MRLTNAKLLTAAVVLAALAALTLASSPARAQDAAATYQAKCAGCHGADGKGSPALVKSMGVRDFSSPEVQKESDEELIAITANGKNKMPGYAKSLKAAQIKDLVAYIHSLGKK
jgi:cytochrome c oxidase cbb3-type subunit III